jgi:hypothetical protein
MDNTGLLARRQVRLTMDAAWKNERSMVSWPHGQPVLERRTGVLRDLELSWATGLRLDDRRPMASLYTRAANRERLSLAASEPTKTRTPIPAQVGEGVGASAEKPAMSKG